MGLDDIVEKVGGYTKAFIQVFLDHEYSYMKFVDKEDLYSKKRDDSRDHQPYNIYKNKPNKEENNNNNER
tara:strand:+ start:119 stop:328 length:210 start_codon:yes stop_codon:yes gene_type:complete